MAHNSGHYEKVRALAVGARMLVVGGARAGAASQLTFFDHVSHKRILAVDVPAHVAGLALGGDAVVAACGDGRLRVYKAGTGAFLREIEAHASRQVARLDGRHGGTVLAGATAVAVAPDGDRVVSAGVDGWLRVHSLSSGKKLHEWSVSNQPLRAAAFDPTGEFVAGAGEDGVVHLVTVVNGDRRELPGHEGAVNALAFTPRDGRVLSGGDDGTLRLFFLVGDTEGEIRGNDESSHVGPVLAVVFAPSPKGATAEQSDRYYSAGADGTLKAWRLGDRRKPRTVELGGALRALALAPKGGSQTTGTLFVGGDTRIITSVPLDPEGNPQDKLGPIGHGLQLLEESLTSSARPAHETAIKAIAALDEPEALELMLKNLASNRFPEVRELVARELGARGRESAKSALRDRLKSESVAAPRLAAYEALKVLEAGTPLAAPRAGLESSHASIRSLALTELALLHASSPLVSGLIADKLRDGDRQVRLAALDAYTSLFPANNPEPFRIAFERGPADLRVEALVRAALARQLSSPTLEPVLARALDDEDGSVRRAAFALRILERPALHTLLQARDQDVARACTEVAQHAARFLQGNTKEITDALTASAQQKLLGPATPKGDGPHGLSEEDLRPLLGAMACRTADTALRGSRGLAELGDTRALGALLQLSREGDKAIRREAARALGALEDPRAKKRLVWMLDDADADVRAAALDAFSKLEASAVELAEGALRSSQQDIRVRGLTMLVKQGTSRSADTDTLLGNALEDESAEVRGEAFRTLWAWHQKDPQKALDRALEARFPDLRLRAVSELESNGKEAWAQERLLATIGDRDAKVAQAAYDALVKLKGKPASGPHLAAMASLHPTVRAAGAEGAKKSPVDEVRSALSKQLNDTDSGARVAALAALDKLVTKESGPLYAGLQSSFYDLKVLAAELLADRHDEQIIDTMRPFLADKDLLRTLGAALAPLRFRGAKALATLGSPRLLKYFATELLKDEAGDVREQAARGLSTASRKGDEGFLLDALGHTDIAVRSWAAEGLSRLGDARALPVLTGHLRHEHQPIRVGAILSFAALGPEGYGGMLQGLEDASKDVQEIVFMLVLARDLRAFRRSESPDLLTSALSSQRPEVRFAAARAIELRSEPARYLAHLVEMLLPPRPEKAADMKDWPAEERRSRLMVGLAEALAGDRPELRYAAAQTLQLRRKPLDFFKQVENVIKPRAAGAAVTPETTPQWVSTEELSKPAKNWLRRLFAEGVAGAEGAAPVAVAVNDSVPDAEQQRLRWLAFGAYVGLLRQVVAGDDEGHRVRRDAIERVVELSRDGYVSHTAAIPPLVRALDDPHYLVRRGAFAALKKLYPPGADEPLTLALSSVSEDVSKSALDELVARGEVSKLRVARALNSSVPEVRKYAFELLEKMCPKGSLEPLIFAIESDHSDMRLGVIERLAGSRDARVSAALVRATQSDHDDLRLRAAELLAQRKDDLAAEVLAGFLRHDDDDTVEQARDALIVLGSVAAVAALGARLAELTEDDAAVTLIEALGRTGHPAAADVLIPYLVDGSEAVATAVLEAATALANAKVRGEDTEEEQHKKRDYALLVRVLRAASHAKEASARSSAAATLAKGPEAGQSEALTQFFTDRDKEVRAAAVDSYSQRVRNEGASVDPLVPILRAGARDLMLSAAEGVAFKQGAGVLRPLLLFVRAGESGERERAILGLGSLGDLRALPELEVIAAGGTPEAPVEESMQLAAVEAFGRLFRSVTSPETRQRLLDRIEQAEANDSTEHQQAAIRALRYIGDERSRLRIEARTTQQRSPSWYTRLEAVKNLVLLGDKASEMVLARALGDNDSDVRGEAKRGLLKLFPGEQTRVELHALLLGGDDLPTEAALYLAEKGEAETLLAKLPEVKDEEARSRLVFGLLRRPELKVSSLLLLLGQDKATSRDNAAWLIGARASGEGATALAASDRTALIAGLIAAEQRAAQGSKKLLGGERDEEIVAWRRTLWALRGVAAKEALGRLRELVVASEEAVPGLVRQEATVGLAALGHDKADVEALKAALRDPDSGVRTAAAGGLAVIVPEQAAALVLAVQPFDPVAFEVAVKRGAAGLLGTEPGRRVALPSVLVAHDTRAIKALLDGAKDEATLLDAIGAAGRCGGDELIASLTAIATDKKSRDVATRKAAYRALKRAKRQAEYQAKASKNHQEVAP